MARSSWVETIAAPLSWLCRRRHKHDLRHAFARTYLANGGDIHRLSEQMGHGSYRITYDVYAEWIPSEDDTPNPLDQRPSESQRWGS